MIASEYDSTLHKHDDFSIYVGAIYVYSIIRMLYLMLNYSTNKVNRVSMESLSFGRLNVYFSSTRTFDHSNISIRLHIKCDNLILHIMFKHIQTTIYLRTQNSKLSRHTFRPSHIYTITNIFPCYHHRPQFVCAYCWYG